MAQRTLTKGTAKQDNEPAHMRRDNGSWNILIDEARYRQLHTHLFPGDGDEHGAILLCGLAERPSERRLLVREIVLARDGIDFVPGTRGYRALAPHFIAEVANRAADENLVYLAVHNHGGTTSVCFSPTDLDSHTRGYPSIRDISEHAIVGWLVFAREAVAGEIWTSDRDRFSLDSLIVVGGHRHVLTARPTVVTGNMDSMYDRQARLFGEAGQRLLSQLTVGVIGAGGGGSLLVQMLARLGVGRLLVIDDDVIAKTNLPRIVGARLRDVGHPKVQIAARVAREANPKIHIEPIRGSVVDLPVAHHLTQCDFLFLATDTMQSRLIFNELVHQYLIPGIQIGAKVQVEVATGVVTNVFAISRVVLPTEGCLQCNGLISAARLQLEGLNPEERRQQQYVEGEDIPDPSVITLNALSASQAANDFLFIMTGLLQDDAHRGYVMVYPCERTVHTIAVVAESSCLTCGAVHRSNYARGDGGHLPCRQA